MRHVNDYTRTCKDGMPQPVRRFRGNYAKAAKFVVKREKSARISLANRGKTVYNEHGRKLKPLTSQEG